jgi:membrane protease subunit HflC
MMTRGLALIAGIIVVVLILGFSVFFTVDQTEQALVLNFGDPVRVLRDPGLKLKRPWQNVLLYDRRVLDLDPPAEEVIASDQKRLVVDTYSRFRITDPLQFYQSVGSEAVARTRLTSIISGSLRRVLGNVRLEQVLSSERAGIVRQIRDEVKDQAKSLGIDVLDVRIRRADLPEENSQAVYDRMKSERQREAAQFRAEGAQRAQEIRSNAERERTVTIAEGQKQAQILRGQGDGQSIGIYADAFGRDKQFFAFYRSLEAYRNALSGSDTTFVLAPDSEFFRYFGSSTGGASPGSATPGSANPGGANPGGPAPSGAGPGGGASATPTP